MKRIQRIDLVNFSSAVLERFRFFNYVFMFLNIMIKINGFRQKTNNTLIP